jgi:hypothetical protein
MGLPGERQLPTAVTRGDGLNIARDGGGMNVAGFLEQLRLLLSRHADAGIATGLRKMLPVH